MLFPNCYSFFIFNFDVWLILHIDFRKEVEKLRKELSDERSSARVKDDGLLSLQKEKEHLESELRETAKREEMMLEKDQRLQAASNLQWVVINYDQLITINTKKLLENCCFYNSLIVVQWIHFVERKLRAWGKS